MTAQANQNMKKAKKIIIRVFWVILCVSIIMFWISLVPSMENRTWLLSYAQQAEAPYFVVAHNSDYDFSGDEHEYNCTCRKHNQIK